MGTTSSRLVLAAGDARVGLRVDDPTLADLVGAMFRDLAAAAADAALSAGSERSVEPVELRLAVTDDRFELTHGETQIAAAYDPAEVVDHLVAYLNKTAIVSRPSLVNLHAAAVVPPDQDRAVVIPAPPTAGKSTLAMAAVAGGWGYLSDELVSVRAGELVGYPKPLTLKHGSRALVPDSVALRELSASQKRWYVRPAELGGHVVEAAQPGAIVFATYSPGAPTDLTQLDASSALLELAVNCQDELDDHGEALGVLAGLVATVPSFSLVHDRLAEATEALASTLGAYPPDTDGPEFVGRVVASERLVGPLARGDVVGVEFGDGAVLHRPAVDALVHINPLAAVLWRALDGSATEADLADAIVSATGLDDDAAKRSVADVLQQLGGAQLLF